MKETITKEIKEEMVEIVRDLSAHNLQMNFQTWLESKNLEIEKDKNKKIIFEHTLFNKVVGTSSRIIHANPEIPHSIAENTPEIFLYLNQLKPMNYLTGLQRNGTSKDYNIKKNKFRIGTLANAQTLEIIANNEDISKLKVFSSIMTKSGQGFYDSIGVNWERLVFKGVPFTELYDKSLVAAIKAGYKF